MKRQFTFSLNNDDALLFIAPESKGSIRFEVGTHTSDEVFVQVLAHYRSDVVLSSTSVCQFGMESSVHGVMISVSLMLS